MSLGDHDTGQHGGRSRESEHGLGFLPQVALAGCWQVAGHRRSHRAELRTNTRAVL
jgi:hypothetical protein